MKNAKIALDSIMANKFRAVLTTLGIIFGVAAVISMLAIGNGAQQKILEQLEIVGVNNIIIKSVYEKEVEGEEEENENPLESKKFSPGLTLKDMENIKKIIPNIKAITPEVDHECYAFSSSIRKKTKAIGVNNSYFSIFNLKLAKGSFFNDLHNKSRKKVCVLGSKIAKQLFPKSSAIGKNIRIESLNLKVIGVLKNLSGVSENLESLGINDYNDEIYVPINTIISRFKNRGGVSVSSKWQWNSGTKPNPNQLDKIVLQLNDSKKVASSGKVIQKIMTRRHNEMADFIINIPEQILKQQKETDDLFNWLLGAIASISLLVGGIGIMNIMLASVMERIKEIGLRRAVGAKKNDIKLQFVLEALFISLFGGIVGIILGVTLSYAVDIFLEMPTKISFFSIILSFIISVFTGIIFGYLPAQKAAEQNPVNSLKYE